VRSVHAAYRKGLMRTRVGTRPRYVYRQGRWFPTLQGPVAAASYAASSRCKNLYFIFQTLSDSRKKRVDGNMKFPLSAIPNIFYWESILRCPDGTRSQFCVVDGAIPLCDVLRALVKTGEWVLPLRQFHSLGFSLPSNVWLPDRVTPHGRDC